MISKIEALLKARFSEEDMKDCFTLEVQLEKSRKLTIFIDSDEGINYKKCARVSRYLEAEIEENSWLPSDYTIDVPFVDMKETKVKLKFK